jgi:hypothetical protein
MKPVSFLATLAIALLVDCVANAQSLTRQEKCMKKPVQSETPPHENRDKSYWTKERMKSAEPIEMPTPKETEPAGKDPDAKSGRSTSGEGDPGGPIGTENN